MPAQPVFPVIWLGDTCGANCFDEECDLTRTTLMFIGALTMEWGNIIDSDGIEWSLEIERRERPSIAKRVSALLGRETTVSVQYRYTMRQSLTLGQIRKRIIRQSERDPGDVMWQFLEHDQIEAGVLAADSLIALYEFLRDEVCQESDDSVIDPSSEL